MAAFVRGILGAGKSSCDDGIMTKGALPSSWYRSDEMYELERRAIFSKKWLLVTHKLRFTRPGDFVRFEEAGFPFFLCLDRDGNLNGFHNTCRHRAYPVINEEAGNAKILACKYHGWSYGINGKLAKAPRYDELSNFEKEKNNLFPIHVHIDHLGFVWINLDSSPNPSIAWEDDFKDVDTQPRFQKFDFTQYKYDHTWDMEGQYNWKTLNDNYNECYHCPTAHPDVVNVTDVSAYRVEPKAAQIIHYAKIKEDSEKDLINSTFYFPNSCMTVSPHFFYLMRSVPTSARTCSMQYEVYRHNQASDEDFQYIDALFKRVLHEDKDLCNAAQKNLNAGVFVNGQMHPQLEMGPLYLHQLVKSLVVAHRSEEEKKKQEIWPARQQVSSSSITVEEMDFCSSLACTPEQKSVLAW